MYISNSFAHTCHWGCNNNKNCHDLNCPLICVSPFLTFHSLNIPHCGQVVCPMVIFYICWCFNSNYSTSISDADMASGAPVINSVEFLLKNNIWVKIARGVSHDRPRQTGHKHYPTKKGKGENLQQNFLPSMVREEKKAMWLLIEEHRFLFPMYTFSIKCVHRTRGFMDNGCVRFT